MLSKIQVQVVLAVAVLAWAVMLFVEGVHLKAAYLKPYSVVVTVVVIGMILFDRWLWRIPPMPRLLRCPVISGTWKGTIQSSWKDPATQERIDPVVAYFAIRQTYSTISLRMLSEESRSESLVAALERRVNSIPRLTSTYENTPGVLIQDQSRIHHGALLLEVHGMPANRLTGWYWTDRDTKGEVVLRQHTHKVFTRFEDADGAIWS
jgi:hypothetical protein